MIIGFPSLKSIFPVLYLCVSFLHSYSNTTNKANKPEVGKKRFNDIKGLHPSIFYNAKQLLSTIRTCVVRQIYEFILSPFFALREKEALCKRERV